MSSPRVIPQRQKGLAGDPILAPSWYLMSPGHILLTCFNGHTYRLDHEITVDGTVQPSVDCPEDGCDFHEFVRLECWVTRDRVWK